MAHAPCYMAVTNASNARLALKRRSGGPAGPQLENGTYRSDHHPAMIAKVGSGEGLQRLALLPLQPAELLERGHHRDRGSGAVAAIELDGQAQARAAVGGTVGAGRAALGEEAAPGHLHQAGIEAVGSADQEWL